jgi:hypothetical protein
MGEDDKLNELLVKCWHDAEIRKRFIANPKGVLAENGIDLPPEVEIVVVEDTARKAHVVLPPMRAQKPAAAGAGAGAGAGAAGALSDSELDSVSGGAGNVPAPMAVKQNAALTKVRTVVVPTHQPQQTCEPGWGNPCSALSQRQYKKGIDYLSHDDEERLAGELMGFRLARYHYTNESSSDPRRLGFIIDDVVDRPSAAIAKDGAQVDLYGYTTMAVATLRVQQQQIAELQKQVEELRAELATRRSSS